MEILTRNVELKENGVIIVEEVKTTYNLEDLKIKVSNIQRRKERLVLESKNAKRGI